MKTLRHNQNIVVQGEKFTVVDLLQEKGYDFIKDWSNDRIFGRKRTTMVTKENNTDLDDWDFAVQVENLEKVYINGSRYMMVIKDLDVCDGLAFIRV